MNTPLPLLPLLLLCPPPVQRAPLDERKPADELLAWRPADELELRKVFRSSFELAFEELTSKMDHREVPKEFLPRLEIDVQRSGELVVADVYEVAEDGGVAAIRRTYERIAASHSDRTAQDGEEVSTVSGESGSELEGRVVVFRREPGGGWAAAYEQPGGDEELLEGLEADLDFGELLPGPEEAAASAERGSWELDAGTFTRVVLEAGGDLGVEEPEGDAEHAPEDPEPEGSIRASLVEERSVGGRELAVVELSGSITHGSERKTTLEHIPVTSGSATETTTIVYEISGELVWDRAAGHLVSLEVSAPVSYESVTVRDEGQPGPAFESTVRLRGSFELAVEAEPAR
jgi:hypothetical protein